MGFGIAINFLIWKSIIEAQWKRKRKKINKNWRERHTHSHGRHRHDNAYDSGSF